MRCGDVVVRNVKKLRENIMLYHVVMNINSTVAEIGIRASFKN